MAGEIQWRGTETGVTLYATIRSKTGTQWNTAGTPNFEAVTAANWADYDIALAESSGNYFYVGTFPAITGNMTAGWYWVDVFKRAGGSPAITDTLQGTIVGYWDGTTFGPWAGDLSTIKGQAVACSAGVTINPAVGSANTLVVDVAGSAQTDCAPFIIQDYDGSGISASDVTYFREAIQAAHSASANIYWYRVALTIHNAAATPADEWLVIPMLGMTEVGTGAVTTPTLTVVDSAGTTLLSAVTLTEIGTTGRYKYVATAANRTTPGASYVATPSGTIAAATRTGPGVQIARDY